jgi:hypothetical protein
VWTAPRHIQDEAVHLVQLEGQERVQQARLKAAQAKQDRRREEVQARNAISRAKAAQEAAEVERAARALAGPPDIGARRHGAALALALLADEYDVRASVGWSTRDPRYAGGIALVDEDCVPVAVLDPEPSLIRSGAFLLLAGLLLIFPGKDRLRRFTRATTRRRLVPMGGYRTATVELPGRPTPPRLRPAGPRPCACEAPRLAVRTPFGDAPAEPCEQMTPAAALYRAACQECGGTYDRPWRRTGRMQ